MDCHSSKPEQHHFSLQIHERNQTLDVLCETETNLSVKAPLQEL